MEEKAFRASKAIDISNRKLTPTEALNVFTKAKLRYKITCSHYDGEGRRGRTADDLIQRTVKNLARRSFDELPEGAFEATLDFTS